MKRLVVILLMVLSLIPLSSEAIRNTPGEFTIRGYKLNRTVGPVIEVVDALTGSLRDITDDYNEIEIDGYYSLGSAANTTAENVSDIAFSYRVYGNSEGSFTVSVTVAPFINTSDKTKVITTSYFLLNETVRFLDSNTETSDDVASYTDETSGNLNQTNNLTISDVTTSTTDKIVRSLSSGTGVLVDKFSVSDGKDLPAASTTDVWIARGAVGFVIDSKSYDEADEGEYKAAITVTLSKN